MRLNEVPTLPEYGFYRVVRVENSICLPGTKGKIFAKLVKSKYLYKKVGVNKC